MENSIPIAFSSMWIFFSVGLYNAVRIRDKMSVVYQKMTCDRATSNIEKF